MSSYRCTYAPWKASLTPSYKTSGTSSAYSSRDDINAPRYTTLSSPSTYRPSFSGGTYRVKRDTVPVNSAGSTYVSRYGGVNTVNLSAPKTSGVSKYGRSREQSPLALERTNRIGSREPSPVGRALKGKSRDPSPAIDNKSKLSYGTTASSYRMSTPRSSSYTTRYNTASASLSSPTRASNADKSISYLTASDAHERSLKTRAKEKTTFRNNPEKTTERAISTDRREILITDTSPQNSTPSNGSTSDTETDSAAETLVDVAVVTRATSPTPPSEKPVQRMRRIDISKTIEKTIQRSTKPKQLVDKEIQSDRLDDSTRYSRFGIGTRVSSYSPHSDNSRYTSSPLRYSASPLSSNSKASASASASATPSEGKSEEKSTTNGSDRNSRSSSKSTTTVAYGKSKLSPPKVVRINSRQSSVENLSPPHSTSKPPAAPKSESPTKTSSSVTVNKDFRKSALNVGPTDRPRKSRTPSSGTDSDPQHPKINVAENNVVTVEVRQERSPSAGSEASNTSCTSFHRRSNVEQKLQAQVRQRCHNKLHQQNNARNIPLNQNNVNNNSNNNLLGAKTNGHKSCAPTSSSSGTDSAGESKKTNKKNVKKKGTIIVSKLATTPRISTTVTSSKSSTGNTLEKTLSTTSVTTPNTTTTTTTDTTPASVSESESPIRITVINKPQQLQSGTSAFADSSPTKTKSSPYNIDGISEKSSNSRIKQLSSVSNFFVARQNDTNSEPIFIESSENSSDSPAEQQLQAKETTFSHSLTVDLKSNITPTLASSATKTSANTSRQHQTKLRSPSDPDSGDKNSTTKTTNNQSPYKDNSVETEATEQEKDLVYDCNHNQNLEEMRFKLRHFDSGEAAWWVNNDTDASAGETETQSASNGIPNHPQKKAGGYWTTECSKEGEESTCNGAQETDGDDESNNENDQNESNYNYKSKVTQLSGKENKKSASPVSNRLEQNGIHSADENTAEVTLALAQNHLERSPSQSVRPISDKKHWWLSGPEKKQFNISRIDSGEKPWWQQDNDNEDENVEENTKKPTVHTEVHLYNNNNNKTSNIKNKSEDVNCNSSINKQPDECDYLNSNHADLNSLTNNELSNSIYFEYSKRPPPLGQCASPVPYIEESKIPSNNTNNNSNNINDNNNSNYVHNNLLGHQSPYDNIPKNNYYQQKLQQQQQQQHQSQKLFISRHENIDELLGGSCRPLREQTLFDGDCMNYFIEEITPDQVRIHDSTAQMPTIMRMERDDGSTKFDDNTQMTSARLFPGESYDAGVQVEDDVVASFYILARSIEFH